MSTTLHRPRTDETDVALGARIKERRIKLGLSQAVLARAAGVSYQQIQKYERGADRMTVGVLIKLAACLECCVGELLGDARRRPEDPLLERLALPGAVELVEKFSRIRDDGMRRSLLKFLNGVASASDQAAYKPPLLHAQNSPGRATDKQS